MPTNRRSFVKTLLAIPAIFQIGLLDDGSLNMKTEPQSAEDPWKCHKCGGEATMMGDGKVWCATCLPTRPLSFGSIMIRTNHRVESIRYAENGSILWINYVPIEA